MEVDNDYKTAKPQVYHMTFEGTKEELIEKYAKEFSEGYSGYDCDIYFKDGTKTKYSFTDEDLRLAKEKHLNKVPSIYGFLFNANWNEPSEVFQAFQTDYDKNSYFDKAGEESLFVIKGKKSCTQYEGGHVSISGDDPEILKLERDTLSKVLKEINKIALEIVEKHKKSLDKNLYNALKLKYK